MSILLAAGMLLAARPLDFYANGPYDSAVPRPESILHFGPGERHSTFRDQERVLLAITSAARSRVAMTEYGETAEGRPLRIYAVSSPENIAHLAEIKADHAQLAQGKGNPSKTIPVVWINECIHGDETASFESAMWTFYNLAAARGGPVAEALKHEVVVLNPVYNPDGHERYVVYYNSVATGSPDPDAFEKREPSVIFGRLNHYRFDMNRDRVAFSQDETKAEFAEMLRWNPQVYIDQHGEVNSYFFPPEPMSVNVNVDRARNAKWTDIFGRATGRAFDSHGMSYYTKDEFDLYYPGYIDSSNTLTGAIGMTHETDGGSVLAETRKDGSVLTLRQGMEKHFTSALAVVEAAADHCADLMKDYASFKSRVSSGEAAGTFKRVVLTSPDPRPLKRLKDHLAHAGIRASFVQPFTAQGAHDYWTGKTSDAKLSGYVLAIDMAQPQGALAKALLEPQSQFEPEFFKAQVAKKKQAPDGETYPGPESAEFYDSTGWALPFAYDLPAWWLESTPQLKEIKDPQPEEHRLGSTTVGYALDYSDQDDLLAAFAAMEQGVRAMVATKPMKLADRSFAHGTFLFLAGRNEDNYAAVLQTVAAKRHVNLYPLTSAYPEEDRYGPGSSSVQELRKPNIGVVMGSAERLSFGLAIWFLMDRTFKLPFTPLSQESLNSIDLDRFTCIVLPPGTSLPHTDRVTQWLEKGNVAVGLGDIGWASQFQELTPLKAETQSLPGSLFLAEMDPRSLLSFGYEGTQIAVPLDGDSFFLKRKQGGSIVALSSDEKAKKLLTGWEWPDDTEKNLAGVLFLQDVPVGGGHLFLYTQDPTARAMWPGLYKGLLDAMVIGPGG